MLHIPTGYALFACLTAVLTLVAFAVSWRREPDLRPWAFGLALQLVGLSLLALRGQVPLWWSAAVGNAAVAGALASYTVGLLRLLNEPVRWPVWALPPAVALVGLSALLDSFQGRYLLWGVVATVQCSYLMVKLWHARSAGAALNGVGLRLSILATAIYLLPMAVRLVTVPLGWDTTNAFHEAGAGPVITLLVGVTSTLLFATGALTMVLERSADALKAGEARYRQLIDAAHEGICVVAGGRFLLVNPRLAELLGRSATALVGQPFQDVVHPDDRERALALHEQRLAGQADGTSLDLRVPTPHLGLRWLRVNGIRFDWHGQPATLNFITDITAERAATEAIRDEALHDALTQLPNRRLFSDRLQQALASNHRDGRHAAIVFLDLDNFKPLNDEHGHAAGDRLLQEVARRLHELLRATDTASRFGGDEFVLLITQLSPQADEAVRQATRAAQKVVEALGRPYELAADAQPGTASGITHRCTASAGVAVFTTSPDGTGDALIERADSAMYRAKEAGRNRAVVVPPAPPESA